MRIISFAWTTPALLAGRKTVTRRDWDPKHAAKFHAGDLVAAYDRSPRFRGRQVAIIRLTCNPYRECTADMPDEDWEGEGFAYLEETGLHLGRQPQGLTPRGLWEAWHGEPEEKYVVRFELVEVMGKGEAVRVTKAGAA